MHLTVPFPEALELALQGGTLPPIVASASCSGSTVRVDLDLRSIPSPSFALRAITALAPIVRVLATFRSFEAGTATFDLVVRAGSIPVQRLLNQFTGLIAAQLRSHGLPERLASVTQGVDGGLIAVVDLQAAAALRTRGLTVTRFTIDEGAIGVAATIHGFSVQRAGSV